MVLRTALLLGFFLWLLCCGCKTAPPMDGEIEALAKEYASLRQRKSALKPGEFDKELSGAGGRFETVLDELGKRLGKPAYTQEDVIRIMGKPDAIKGAGDRQPGSLGEPHPTGAIEEDVVLLVYFWRGWHDYLYFVSRGGVIQEAKWYFAGE